MITTFFNFTDNADYVRIKKLISSTLNLAILRFELKSLLDNSKYFKSGYLQAKNRYYKNAEEKI